MICKKEKWCLGVLLMLWVIVLEGVCFGQTRKELEKERENTRRDIELSNILLKKGME